MKIATWNINGVKARIDTALEWLKEASPDIACLQEIKSIDENFPRQPFEDLGYNVETHGQKGFNGVALLSRLPLEDVERGLPENEGDDQARYIEAGVSTAAGPVRVGCLYLPNGNPLGTEKFSYKLKWMERLIAHAERRLCEETPFVLLGDYNVIPDPIDAKNPENWLDDALYQSESRERFRALTHLGLTEAVRACTEAGDMYTFWDYQAGAWQKNNGIRIDHILMSPQATDRLAGCGIDKHVRSWEKPSDHVPVWVKLAA
ncbi:exodeoxyribonuclease III [Roseibium salinum]|uniref:Exodeoxyribonuclease III n=1 Tax=Roseibium salinum TaxID=1604349 RepID=A0ABT3R103_9HYPH|nr:exodeoxyribonuclease III [Roseibium sp. DSM 29163]MCX2722806.1 exodeoxyribonuclease III [Roseibium sp. DSM 29163]